LLQPIGFLSLIWNTMLGYLLFFQKPDVWTFVGAAVIFASALYISHREAVRRAQIKTATAKANPEA
jgi:drug/metabolite transporter (DMT)-like permease